MPAIYSKDHHHNLLSGFSVLDTEPMPAIEHAEYLMQYVQEFQCP